MSGMKNKHILLAENSLEGILSAVSYAYKSRYGHEYNKIMIAGEEGTMELFSEYIDVPADPDASKEVYKAIRSKLGLEFFEYVEYCALSDFDDRAEVIYRSLILAFANNIDILNYRKADCITRLHVIYKSVLGEVHHWTEFLRFKVHDMRKLVRNVRDEETEDEDIEVPENKKTPAVFEEYSSAEQYLQYAAGQFLTSVIEPKHRIVRLLAPFFEDRYSAENFLIYDKIHDEAAVHSAGKDSTIVSNLSGLQPGILELIGTDNSQNARMSGLWKIFYDTTFIQERENRELQRSLMPLRFRGDMVEQRPR